jgi:uncharacterized peroxidase-related enzyme
MPHIQLPEMPGILSLLTHFPEAGAKLGALTETLLRGPSPLSPAEREIIAAFVSQRNECRFCTSAHSAAARHLAATDRVHLVEQVCTDLDSAPVSEKLRALLRIAGKVAEGGRSVMPDDVARAREHGAGDREIHDTVLVAAAFCMFNRYVDGLATWTPDDERLYDVIGARLASDGYVMSTGKRA